MDEYPREVAELLSLAKDAHDPPDPEARARVRQRIAVTIAGGAALGVATKAVAKGSAQAGLFSSITAKVAVASVAMITAGTIAVTQLDVTRKGTSPVSKSAAHAPSTRKAGPEHQAPVGADVVPEPLREANAQAPAPNENSQSAVVTDKEPNDADPVVKRATKGAHAGKSVVHAKKSASSDQAAPLPVSDSLREEMHLLQATSEALLKGDNSRALGLLDRYRETFSTPLLRSEYDGLRLIARCQSGEGRARLEAKRLLARSHKHVLFTRIASACKLEESK